MSITTAQLIMINPESLDSTIVVESHGDTLQLRHAYKRGTVFSIVDKGGCIIAHAHNWLSSLSAGIGHSISEGSVEQYGRTISYLCRWIESEKPYPSLSINETIEILNRQDISAWLTFMRNGGVGNNTLNSREVAAKEFLSWLTTDEGGNVRTIKDSPWGRDNLLPYIVKKSHPRSPKFINSEVVIAILSSIHNECERCMFHTQYDTGLRIAELVDLRLGDLPSLSLFQDQNTEFLPLYIQGVKGRSGNKKERVTLISRAVLNRIRRYHNTLEYKLAVNWSINDPNKPVFLTSNNLKWTKRNASKQLKAAAERSGIVGRFPSHWLRHGTAFSVLSSDIGKDYEDRMLTIQAMLGHAHIKTTEIYTQISPAMLSKLNAEGKKLDRLGEAEKIRKATYLAPLKHKEHRGHRER